MSFEFDRDKDFIEIHTVIHILCKIYSEKPILLFPFSPDVTPKFVRIERIFCHTKILTTI